VCSYMAMTSLGSQKHSGITCTTGVLKWVDTVFSGRTGWEGEERELPFVAEMSGNACSSA